MERKLPIMFSVAELLVLKVSEGINKYGKYVKWGVNGLIVWYTLAYFVDEIVFWYYTKREREDDIPAYLLLPPPENPSTCTLFFLDPNPVIAGHLAEILASDIVPRLRPPIFMTSHGYIQLPPLGNLAAIYAYTKQHQRLSDKFSPVDARLGMFHTNLLNLVHHDPETYFVANSASIPVENYRTWEIGLTVLVRMLDREIERLRLEKAREILEMIIETEE